MFHDESLLFTAGEDGSVFVFDVKQELKGGMKRDVERIAFADEVMVTKSDLEEKKSKCDSHLSIDTFCFTVSCCCTQNWKYSA